MHEESFSFSQWYLYSSVRKFIIEGTDENGENWYTTNNNQFTVYVAEIRHSRLSDLNEVKGQTTESVSDLSQPISDAVFMYLIKNCIELIIVHYWSGH